MMDTFRIYFDGGAKPNPGHGYGSYCLEHKGRSPVKRVDFGDRGVVTNNQAEYLTMIEGITAVNDLIVPPKWRPDSILEIVGDSRLVLSQVSGAWEVNEPELLRLCRLAQSLAKDYAKVQVRHVPRAQMVTMFGH